MMKHDRKRDPSIDSDHQCMDHLDTLPTNILHKLIDLLNVEERLNLGLSCKKLHEFERSAGKRRFKCIRISWKESGRRIKASRVPVIFFVKGSDEETRAFEFFRDCTTELLSVETLENEKCTKSLTAFCKTIKCRNFVVKCNGNDDTDILPSLLDGRDFNDCKLLLDWKGDGSCANRVRKFLQNLPLIPNLALGWSWWSSKWRLISNYPIDDATLLHLVKNTQVASVGIGCCTTQGLVDVFKVMEQWSLPGEKKITFLASKAAVSGLCAILAEDTEYTIHDNRFLICIKHERTKTALSYPARSTFPELSVVPLFSVKMYKYR
ncbi:hypothetical protein PFISCL1PPCAC_25778 [Pristionchus fissidentatus]|uniref:F-box domain-containing protein n=1 Tax=Pristionchus fissidentatus TaxID=1538716 RepID=A0AAV5WR45_9BILA|nr:hypothetical protein PFISCL1PPCAC_25778 [Pristionchus fissidentatus]